MPLYNKSVPNRIVKPWPKYAHIPFFGMFPVRGNSFLFFPFGIGFLCIKPEIWNFLLTEFTKQSIQQYIPIWEVLLSKIKI